MHSASPETLLKLKFVCSHANKKLVCLHAYNKDLLSRSRDIVKEIGSLHIAAWTHIVLGYQYPVTKVLELHERDVAAKGPGSSCVTRWLMYAILNEWSQKRYDVLKTASDTLLVAMVHWLLLAGTQSEGPLTLAEWECVWWPTVYTLYNRGHHEWYVWDETGVCLLYTSPSPRDGLLSRMPSSA